MNRTLHFIDSPAFIPLISYIALTTNEENIWKDIWKNVWENIVTFSYI